MLPVKVGKRGRSYFPEARIVRGPRVMGETADNSFEALLGYAWLGMLDRTQGLRLFQARKTAPSSEPWPIGSTEEAQWVEVTIPPIPHPVKEVRHLALCFDQAARHVVAYERQGEVWIRQWNPITGTFTMRGPFPGVDPVLLWDFEVGYFLPDSDVLLVHLSPDRTHVIMRVQRELYATSHVLQTFPSPAYLDQAVALPYQGQILGSLEDSPNVTGLVLRTDPYPVRGEDDIGNAALAAPTQGALIPVVVIYDGGLDALGQAVLSAPNQGALVPVVAVLNLGLDALGNATLTPPTSGAYQLVVVVQDLGADALGTATLSAPTSGAYQLVVVVVDLTQPQYLPLGYENLGSAILAAPTAGSYGP
mgnify:CR=1 FL=1|jgi:hypothetical protein